MRDFSNIKRLIIKVGSSSLVNEDYSINMPKIVIIMQQFKILKEKGIDITLVTSGAIAAGMHEINLKTKPKEMALKQACAAIGQAKLMEAYNKVASIYDLKLGQVLVNHEDFNIKNRMNCLKETLEAMFINNIIPVINENDALAVEEIKVGDNDTLSSLIVPLINSDLLILFSDIDGLYNKNPKVYDDAYLIKEVKIIDKSIINMIGEVTSQVGTGGMKTKIDAAIIATLNNSNMIIANSDKLNELVDIINGEEIGTLFVKNENKINHDDDLIKMKDEYYGRIIN